jgi:hypothetical protein
LQNIKASFYETLQILLRHRGVMLVKTGNRDDFIGLLSPGVAIDIRHRLPSLGAKTACV